MVLVFARPPRVRVTIVNWTSRAIVSGSRAAVLSPVSRRRRARMPSDSCSMTSSEPSGRVLPVVVAADRGGGPSVRGGADQGDDAEHGVLPPGGHPERGGQLVIGVQGGG